MSKGTNVLNRIAHRHGHTPSEPAEEPSTSRPLKRADSTEYLAGKTRDRKMLKPMEHVGCLERSPKATRAPVKEPPRFLTATQSRAPAPTSPKPPAPVGASGWRRSVLMAGNEQDAFTTPTDPENSNMHVIPSTKKNGTPVDDEGALIAHDLLDLVKQEEEKDQHYQHQQQHHRAAPPAIPLRKRATSGAQDGNLDIEVETTTRLAHPGIKQTTEFIGSLHRQCHSSRQGST